MSKNSKLIVKQVRSAIGRQGYQRKTLIGLGLNKINKQRELDDTPIKSMIESKTPCRNKGKLNEGFCMELNKLNDYNGTKSPKKRLGRVGSGLGKTSERS